MQSHPETMKKSSQNYGNSLWNCKNSPQIRRKVTPKPCGVIPKTWKYLSGTMKSHASITGNPPQTIRKLCQHHGMIAPQPRWSFHNHAKAIPNLTWPSANSPWPSAIRPTSSANHPQPLEMSPRNRAKFIPQPWKHHPETTESHPCTIVKTNAKREISSRKYAKYITKLWKITPRTLKITPNSLESYPQTMRSHPKNMKNVLPERWKVIPATREIIPKPSENHANIMK